MKFVVYLNFISVYIKFPVIKNFLNVEQLRRPPAFLSLFARLQTSGGYALTLAACSVRNIISPELGGRYSPLLDVSCSSCCARDEPWDGRCLGGHLSSPGLTICASANLVSTFLLRVHSTSVRASVDL